MKRATRRAEAGYTIIETMIFLIISGALMASAALLFNGKISRSQFAQAAQAFNSQINTTINDVATGTYPSGGNFSCMGGGSSESPKLSSDAASQGTNQGCVFVGKVLQPGVADDKCAATDTSQCSKYNVYSVMGNRLDSSGNEVTSLARANPKAIDDTANNIDLTEYKSLPSGIFVTGIFVKDTKAKLGAVGFFQTFGQYDAKGLASSAQNVQAVAVGNSFPLPQTGAPSLDQAIQDLNDPDQPDVSSGIVICLSGGGNQSASITIGLNNSNLTTDLAIGQDGICQ